MIMVPFVIHTIVVFYIIYIFLQKVETHIIMDIHKSIMAQKLQTGLTTKICINVYISNTAGDGLFINACHAG